MNCDNILRLVRLPMTTGTSHVPCLGGPTELPWCPSAQLAKQHETLPMFAGDVCVKCLCAPQ